MARRLSPVAWAAIVGVVALIALLAYGLANNEADTGIRDSLAKGEREEAPDFDLPALDGDGSATLADYKGQVVVLNFWASWCEPCRDESPLLQNFHEEISKRKGTVVGIDILDVSDDARAFVKEYGLTYPQLRDKSDDTREDYQLTGQPETYVIDRRGRIAARRLGPVDEKFLDEEVRPLLRERS